MQFSRIKFKIKYLLIIFIFFFMFGIKNVSAIESLPKVMDIDGSISTEIYKYTNVDDITYFIYSTDQYGSELWRTDGTTAGTYIVKDINPDSANGASWVYSIGDTIYLIANDGVHGFELWKSDGTSSGTVLIKDINTTLSESIVETAATFATYNNMLYFMANDGVNGIELWKSDGTEDGTYMVKDINPEGSSNPMMIDDYNDEYGTKNYIVYNNILYFGITNSSNAGELWRTDGTEAGTYKVATTSSPDTESQIIREFTIYNNEIYFIADFITTDDVLWKSDGTAEGTSVVLTATKTLTEDAEILGILDNKLFFSATTPEYGTELWVTDGTMEGTYQYADICDNLDHSCDPRDGIVYKNKLYFSIFSFDDDLYKFYVLDNASSEPHEFMNFNPDSIVTNFFLPITVFEDNLYIIAFTDQLGWPNLAYELWRTDGTVEGTELINKYLTFNILPVMVGNNALYLFKANNYINMEDDEINYWMADIEMDRFQALSISNYIVKFNDYDGTTLKTQSVSKGSNATAPSNPTRRGYTFTGWNKTFNNITGNLTVTAKYSINSYTVTFKDYDGTVLKKETVQYGKSATPPTEPIREEYTFTGWNYGYSNITKSITITAMYQLTSDVEEPKLVIDNITDDTTDEEINTITGNIEVISSDSKLINIYDVSLIKDGVKVQPNGNIEIRILMTEEQEEYENLQVIYIDDDNNVTVIPHTIDGNYIVFTVNHLSKYAVIGEKKTIDNPKDISDTDKNDSNNNIFLIGGIALFVILILLIIFGRKKSVK